MQIPKGSCECGCGGKTRLAPENRTRLGWIKGQPIKRLAGHGRKSSAPEYVVDPVTGCWIWQRALNSAGYGKTGATTGTRYAHRMMWQRLRGPIPDGLTVDHLCRNKACVNAIEHLELVTAAENIRRAARLKTSCKRGHPFDADNTFITVRGRRQCRACDAIRAARYRAAKREAEALRPEDADQDGQRD